MTDGESMLERHRELHEIVIDGVTYTNLTDYASEELVHRLPRTLIPERVVFLPDFSPGRPEDIPTGVCVELDPRKNPEWRTLLVTDVGCGIAMVEGSVDYDTFTASQDAWDAVATEIKDRRGRPGDLGSGNHFLDAVIKPDGTGNVHFVVHTGTPRSDDREQLAKAAAAKDAEQFAQIYASLLNGASENRAEIIKIVEMHFGKASPVVETTHNTHIVTPGGSIRIYKGAVPMRPGENTIIPSTMNGDMIVAKATDRIDSIMGAMSHGTGRIMPRSQARAQIGVEQLARLRTQLMIPTLLDVTALASDHPSCYRDMMEFEQMMKGYYESIDRLTPIGYMGQL